MSNSQPALQDKDGQGQGMGLTTQGDAAKGFLVKHNPLQLLQTKKRHVPSVGSLIFYKMQEYFQLNSLLTLQ